MLEIINWSRSVVILEIRDPHRTLRNPEFRQPSKSVNVYQPVIQMHTSDQMKVTGVVPVDDRSKQTRPPNGAGFHPVVAMREYRLDIFNLFSREVRSLEPYVQS